MDRNSHSAGASVLARLYQRLETLPGKAPEIAAIALYAVFLCVVSAFHEPWFDEAQAWQIARCAPIREILFSIPHYEGHPPLWHLLLSVPAKLGAPYEWSIKSISILICLLAVWILVFRSPFPRIVRMVLPFCYFLFYQYGVIARPYSLLFLSFMLAAAVYQSRDEKPFRYMLALVLLCLSSAYGIVFAGGLSLVWMIQICRAAGLRRPLKQILRDGRTWALLVLMLVALANILLILPYRDTFAVAAHTERNGFFIRLLYAFAVLPADACFFDCFSSNMTLRSVPFDTAAFAAGALLGLFFWAALLFLSRRKKSTLLLILPYAMFSLFSAAVYFSQHHIGVAFLFLLFWAWVDTGTRESEAAACGQPPSGLIHSPRFLEFSLALRVFCAVVVLSVSIFWTVSASLHEISWTYGFGREAAAFLKENNLEDRAVMCSWGEFEDAATGQITIDTNYSGGVTILPYFEHNILINVNGGSDSLAYLTHQKPDDETNRANFSLWASRGAPDVLLGPVDLEDVFGDTLTMRSYAAAVTLEAGSVWKTGVIFGNYSIDLLQPGR